MNVAYDLDRVAYEERQHDRMQAAREEDYAMRSEPIIDELAAQIIDGDDICHMMRQDFVENITAEDIDKLIFLQGDALADFRCDIRERLTKDVKDWLRDSYEGNQIVERELDESH